MIYNIDFLISAMVIGVAEMFGIKLPENFRITGYFFSLPFLERQMLLLNFSLITILLHTTAIWELPQSS